MKRMMTFLLVFVGTSFSIFCQKTVVKAEVSADTIEWGSYLTLEISIKGTAQNVQIKPFDIQDFDIVGGPMQSSSYSNINGKVSQSATYTYYLQPKQVGKLKVEPISVWIDGEELSIKSIPVFVAENPDGSYETTVPQHSYPTEQTKPKRSRTSIRI